MRDKHVSAIALGNGAAAEADGPRVFVSFYGPRGGFRAGEVLEASEARKLGEALIRAAEGA